MSTTDDVERDPFDVRPTADEMLARVRAEGGEGRGRLRVYLGMAPGVGKTYRMLEEAHRRVERGTDLVVGYVEAHGRPGTSALLDGLETVPRRRLEHRGVVVEEMDTDAILARRPTVAIVDELAHTNVPGSDRAQRWEDVEVLRDAGIHVISTCNVQHVDTVADAVATIVGAPVNERLPAWVIAEADEVELVDMSPHALRQRMRHGNVYPPERTAVALDRFFTESNLTALRDLALRFVTRTVDDDLDTLLRGRRGGAAPWRAIGDRVLVLVDESPAAPRAIRRAAALAASLHAPLVGLVVEPQAGRAFDPSRDLREHLDDATDLGAEVIRVEGSDAGAALIEVARQRRATHVVLPYQQAGSRFAGLTRRSLSDAVLAAMPDVEVHLVADASRDRPDGPSPRGAT